MCDVLKLSTLILARVALFILFLSVWAQDLFLLGKHFQIDPLLTHRRPRYIAPLKLPLAEVFEALALLVTLNVPSDLTKSFRILLLGASFSLTLVEVDSLPAVHHCLKSRLSNRVPYDLFRQ